MQKKKLEFREDETGCFIVTSHRLNKDGYCYLRHIGREQRAHRMIYQECFGEIPEGFVVRHKCDVPSCINPEHLELGTQAENMKDRDIRLRNANGERNGRSEINESQALEIKRLFRDGTPISVIASNFKISYMIVWRISKSRLWKHINSKSKEKFK